MLRTVVLWAFLSLALVLPGCTPALRAAPSPDGPATTAIVDVAVVPLDSERVLAGQTVLVRSGKIVAMGPTASVPVPDGARVLDGRGKYLMPGLADMHAHLTREEDMLLYLARGVTTVRNMQGSPLHLSWRERVRNGEMVGPTIYTAGPIVDGERPSHDGSLVVLTVEEADRAVALHKQAGYDFLKVYNNLTVPVYERLMASAKTAGLPVAGHVPRAVGLLAAVGAGQVSIEHLNAFTDALQADDSPVAGKFDRASRQKKIDFVDERKIPSLVARIREKGAWVCPTRTVMNQLAAAAETRQRLSRPEMKYVPACDKAIWEPDEDPPPDVFAGLQRSVALGDRIIRALRDGGAHLLVGTDTANPLVIPGFSVHEELTLLVHAGLTPYEALRAGTRDAAEFLHAAAEFGTIAVGQRADLLLIEGNPLTDVTQADRITGVMARGRWFGESERAALLAKAEAFAQGRTDPLAGAAALIAEGKQEFAGTYEVTWRGARFGMERILVERGTDGQQVIRAQTFDLHEGQGKSMRLSAGATGVGQKLLIESDGAKGRGRVEATREGTQARGRGTLLSGAEAVVNESLPDAALLGADGFLASKILLSPRLGAMSVGQTLEVSTSDVALGSAVKMPVTSFAVTRTPDATFGADKAQRAARRYEIKAEKGPPSVLFLDEQGWPVGLETTDSGATARYQRVGP